MQITRPRNSSDFAPCARASSYAEIKGVLEKRGISLEYPRFEYRQIRFMITEGDPKAVEGAFSSWGITSYQVIHTMSSK